MASSMLLSAGQGHGDVDLPTSAGSLRETFELPMLGEDEPRSPARGAASGPDPLALFKDDPPARRKPLAAEGRARARRCPTCGGVVPQGMSLCSTCGLDLETGNRIDLTEDIGTMPGRARQEAPPIGGWIVAGLTCSACLIFSVISLLKASQGESAYLCLLLVCAFGIYAAVQFLRLKSLRLLLIALTLGVGIDVVALICLPVYEASQVEVQRDAKGPDDDGPAIVSMEDKLDTQRMSWGIAILISYAAISLYLNSPPVKKRFR